jgi:hypothetical protein
MSKIYAVVKTFNAGYNSEEEKMRNMFELNQKIEVDSIVVNSWSTDIYLKEYEESFNSVFFKIVDEEDVELEFIYGEECEHIRVDNY